MFKEENQIFLYLLGTLVLFGVLLVAAQNVSVSGILGLGRIFYNPSDRFSSAPSMTINTELNYTATFSTSMGDFTVDLFEKNAPSNVNNFVFLSNNSYYNGTTFHRLVPNILLQGGDRNTLNSDPYDDGQGRAGYVINDEINLSNLPLSDQEKDEILRSGLTESQTLITQKAKKYTVFMATDGYNTVSTQFFIVLADSSSQTTHYFNGRYTPIGEVVSGYDTLQSINSITVDNPGSHFSRPTENIVLHYIAIQAN